MPEGPLAITDPKLQRLYDYWRQKRGDRFAPQRADMKPEELGLILSYIYILDVVEPPPHRFRYRLAGTDFVREYGGEITGKFADEIDLDGVANLVMENYVEAARDGQPRTSKWDFVKHDGRELKYERLVLPLSADGKIIDTLFCAALIKGIGPLARR